VGAWPFGIAGELIVSVAVGVRLVQHADQHAAGRGGGVDFLIRVGSR